MSSMIIRTPGYYLVEWSGSADPELVARRPGPLVGERDGRVWWFSRMQAYQFDCDVTVIGEFTGATTAVSSSMARTSAAA